MVVLHDEPSVADDDEKDIDDAGAGAVPVTTALQVDDPLNLLFIVLCMRRREENESCDDDDEV